MVEDRPVYSGRAIVSNLINTGAVLVCEATLEDFWLEPDFFLADGATERTTISRFLPTLAKDLQGSPGIQSDRRRPAGITSWTCGCGWNRSNSASLGARRRPYQHRARHRRGDRPVHHSDAYRLVRKI
jgi:hypothetical protein